MRKLLPGHGASRGSALGRARVRLPHALAARGQFQTRRKTTIDISEVITIVPVTAMP